MFSERDLVDAFTGLVVDAIAVDSDAGAAETDCDRCGRTLSTGDAVTATLAHHEEHTWGPTGEFHPDALTFGGVVVIDYSPAEEGYE